MKKINHVDIFFILFLSALLAKADKDGEEYEINPPDITDLRLPSYTMLSEVYGVRPKEWNIRAVAINNYILEFDKQANVISVDGEKQHADGRAVTGHLVELYSKYDNRAVWKGSRLVYYWAEEPNNTKGLSNIMYGGAVLIKIYDKVCPAQIVSGGYTLDITYSNDDTRMFLNGDCDKTIDKEINGRLYKTYPPSKKIDPSNEVYWTIQYFSDPITPMYDQNNKCVLYCDVKEARK